MQFFCLNYIIIITNHLHTLTATSYFVVTYKTVKQKMTTKHVEQMMWKR